jgi:hypothetical protein
MHIDKSCKKQKDASTWEYVHATKMFSYSTKDLMLAHLLAWVEKKIGIKLFAPHSKFLAIPLSLVDSLSL